MIISSVVGMCLIELSLLTIGVSMPYHGFVGITRRRPLFVGRRYFQTRSTRPSSVYFGRQVQPLSLGRKKDNEGSKLAPLFLGKKAAPSYFGLNDSPMFIGKRKAPMFPGKRVAPLVLGKRRDGYDRQHSEPEVCFEESDCAQDHCCAHSGEEPMGQCIPKGRIGDVCRSNLFEIGDSGSYQCPCQRQLDCFSENFNGIGVCVSRTSKKYAKWPYVYGMLNNL